MPKQIKDGVIVENRWQFADSAAQAGSNSLVTLSEWLEHSEQLSGLLPDLGLRITAEDNLEPLQAQVNEFPIIEVYFNTFMDGRGFSLGRLLRERLGFTGQLRAGGNFIRDQLCYLRRCGFNGFAFDDASIALEPALQSLYDFTDGYQPSVDQPQPLFVRRA